MHLITVDSFETLKHLLTEVRVEDDSRTVTYNRLARHVAESLLTFRDEVPGDGNCMFHAVADQLLRTEGRRISHVELRKQVVDYLRQNPLNGVGDHLRNFVPDQNWERYLNTMSRDGTWGDHIVLQAMADMFGHDVSIVSSVEAENYVTILTPSTRAVGRKEPPLLLGHYAENHYASLDGKSFTPPRQMITRKEHNRNMIYDQPNQHFEETDDSEASENTGPSSDDDDGKIAVKVQPCTDAFWKQTVKKKSPYRMGSLPRGYALILNNTKFDKSPDRKAGDVDLDNIKDLLEGLSFKTYILQNKKAQTIKEKIRAFSTREKHGEMDCCIVVLMSHGSKGVIAGTDNKAVQLDDIFTMFDNKNCPGLKGKPKLFFIQACRGGNVDKGVAAPEDEDDSLGTDPNTDLQALLSKLLHLSAPEEDEADGPEMIPTRTDMLCCYATQLGNKSFRSNKSGSWFIQAITKVFMEHAKDSSLLEMMTKVRITLQAQHCYTSEVEPLLRG
ncbi:caspase-2-like [Branchiostoma floridae x Branchiostoma japonicum]